MQSSDKTISTIQPEHYLSPEEYFAMEEQAAYKSEYEEGKS